ncbi:TniQ family protein [Pseudomonas faucium]|uniref:TniQ family protein n=1 Tax=Pseudomonas faucium TaxID=2740518 RepID=UPI0015970BE7|nr:TniQ family protein [Pseudomonas faucium]
MGHFPHWISSTDNELVLQRCLNIVQKSDTQSSTHYATQLSGEMQPVLSQPANIDLQPRPGTQVILLSGDAGCGMSALTHQICRRLCRRGIHALELPELPSQQNATFIHGLVEALGLPPQMMASQKSQIETIYSATFKLRQIQVTIMNDVQSYMRHPYSNASPTVTKIAEFIHSGISKFVFLCATTLCCDALAEGLDNGEISYSRVQIKRMPYGASYIDFVTDTVESLTGSPEIPESLPLELHQLSDGLIGVSMRHIRCLVGPRSETAPPYAPRKKTWFRGFCRPVNDEVFSSWLMRNAFTKDVLSVTATDLYGCRQAARLYGGGDVDRVSHMATKNVLPKALRISTLARTFRLYDSRVFPSHYLLAYCPRCLADDVACGRLPSWRKTWRQYGYCVCDNHEVPVTLSVLQHPNPDPFFKAWDAYMEYVQSPLFRLKRRLVSSALSEEKLLMQERKVGLLILRVQNWMVRQVLTGHCRALSPAGARFILNVLLHEPIAKRSPGGFARTYFNSRDLIHVFYTSHRNPGDFHGHYLTASPRQTLTAYLLVGIAYDMIKQSEAAFLHRVFGITREAFPTCRSKISYAAATMFLPEHWAEMKCTAQRDLPFDDLLQIAWIFEYASNRK